MTNALPHNLRGKIFLPERYQPSASDVICGRGTASFYHPGNQAFRQAIAESLKMYGATSDKRDKSMIVSAIVNKFCFNEDTPSRFIRFCDSEKLWYEISYDQVRQKVGQTLRETLVQQDPQILSRKKHCRAFRSSIKRCTRTNANGRTSQSVATTSTHPEEHMVHSERDDVAVSVVPHVPCMQYQQSIFSKWSPHYEAVPSSIQVQLNASSHGQQHFGDLSLANLEWGASFHKAVTDGTYSDTLSLSSCHWFQDCDEKSLSNCDWLEGDDGSFWK